MDDSHAFNLLLEAFHCFALLFCLEVTGQKGLISFHCTLLVKRLQALDMDTV